MRKVVQGWCERVFWWEGVLLLVSGLMLLVAPEHVMTMQGIDKADANNVVARSNMAQFGAMCLLMAYVGLFVPVQARIVQACLLGDLLWFYAFLQHVSAVHTRTHAVKTTACLLVYFDSPPSPLVLSFSLFFLFFLFFFVFLAG